MEHFTDYNLTTYHWTSMILPMLDITSTSRNYNFHQHVETLSDTESYSNWKTRDQ